MAHLKFEGINKIYDNGFHAVHDFNLEVEKGEFIVFVGPSGCGKSTTLRMIAGLEEISDGKFYIGGELANDLSPRERGVAMVFQSYALYPHMTVFENMAFGLTLKGCNQDIIDQRVMRTAKILGLTDYLERKPRELSGGQRQRVAVGRAIIRRVEVFLMDEPLSNLDAKQRVTMRSEIIAIHRRVGATTIYVTHDQTEAMTMADRIVVMKDGWAQQVGTPHELYFDPVNMFVAAFIGEPPMNFLEMSVSGGVAANADGVACDIGGLFPEAAAAYEGRRLVLGFRPEGADLCGESAPEGSAVFECKVNLTEMLGDSVNVYATMGAKDIIIKVSPYDMPEIGDVCRFSVPAAKLYLFDPDTTEAVARK